MSERGTQVGDRPGAGRVSSTAAAGRRRRRPRRPGRGHGPGAADGLDRRPRDGRRRRRSARRRSGSSCCRPSSAARRSSSSERAVAARLAAFGRPGRGRRHASTSPWTSDRITPAGLAPLARRRDRAADRARPTSRCPYCGSRRVVAGQPVRPDPVPLALLLPRLPPAVRSHQAGLTVEPGDPDGRRRRRRHDGRRDRPGRPRGRPRRPASTTSTRPRSSAASSADPRRPGAPRRATRPRRRRDRRLGRRAGAARLPSRARPRRPRRRRPTSSSRPRSRTSRSSARSSAALDRGRAATAILATNTSALSVAAIAAATTRPARVIGLHFFNPAPVMRARRGRRRRRDRPGRRRARGRAHDGAGARRRSAAADTPGFIVNRVNRPFTLEALADPRGAARPTSSAIDGAMRAAGYPMGPFELMDLDRHRRQPRRRPRASAAALAAGDPLAERFRPSPIQERLVAERPSRAQDRQRVLPLRRRRPDRVASGPGRRRGRSGRRGSHRRARRARDRRRGVSGRGDGVASPADIDMALRLGAGHPSGPFERVDAMGGPAVVLARLRALADPGPRFVPAPALVAAATRMTAGRTILRDTAGVAPAVMDWGGVRMRYRIAGRRWSPSRRSRWSAATAPRVGRRPRAAGPRRRTAPASAAAPSEATPTEAAPSEAAASEAAPSDADPELRVPEHRQGARGAPARHDCAAPRSRSSAWVPRCSPPMRTRRSRPSWTSSASPYRTSPSRSPPPCRPVAAARPGSSASRAPIAARSRMPSWQRPRRRATSSTVKSIGGKDIYVDPTSDNFGYAYFKGDAIVFASADNEADAATILAVLP